MRDLLGVMSVNHYGWINADIMGAQYNCTEAATSQRLHFQRRWYVRAVTGEFQWIATLVHYLLGGLRISTFALLSRNFAFCTLHFALINHPLMIYWGINSNIMPIIIISINQKDLTFISNSERRQIQWKKYQPLLPLLLS